MGERVWTSEQECAINDLGHNLLVSAAAGSGKTAVLIERIVKLIVSGKANVDELLVVTFTEAAALEMKTKLYKALDENGMKDQLERLTEANISDFHKFALSVIRCYYHVIGLDPSLSVCDKIKAGLLQEEALEDLFELKFNEKDPDFIYLLDQFETGPRSGVVKDMIRHLYSFLMSMPYPWDWTTKVLTDDSLIDTYLNFGEEEVLSLLYLARDYHVVHQKLLKEKGVSRLAEKALIDIEYVDSIISAIESDKEKGLDLFANDKKQALTTLRPKEDEKVTLEELKPIRDNAKQCREKAYELAQGLNRKHLELERKELNIVLEKLFNLTKEFADLYQEKKANEACLDFSDMEHFALEILEHEEVALEYKNKFKFIFVDEYQDTNSLQETLIGKVKGENNLFMVGDVKQCIYKFRQAEPELFMNHYDEYKANEDGPNKLINLNANFRSKENLLSSINYVFSRLMTKNSCGIIYDDEASLKPGIKSENDISYDAKLEIVNTSSSISPISELKNAEVAALEAAMQIKSYVGKPIFDSEKGIVRNLEYKDMVVLLPQQKNVGEVFYKYFVDNNIPVYLERNTGYFDTIEIGVFINLLKIIDNPKEDIPLLSVLCCPIFGFNADDLAEIRLSNEDVSFSDAFFEYAKNHKKAKAFANMLSDFKEKSKVLPLADFIYELLLNTGYLDFNAAQNAGRQKLANLKALIDRAEQFEKTNALGLSSFISFAENLSKHSGNFDFGQAKTISSAMNCVQIMTIHKSKGLEFPFVIVSGLEKKLLGKSDAGSFILNKDLGASLRLYNKKSNVYVDTKIGSLIKLKNDRDNLAERIRLLYVAMTRAKDILILTGNSKLGRSSENKALLPNDIVNASTYLDLLVSAMPRKDILVRGQESLEGFVKQNSLASEDFEETIKQGFKAIDEETVEILSYPYFEKKYNTKRKYSVSQIAESNRKEVYKEADFKIPMFVKAEDHGLSANERGTAYHAVMEHIPFTQGGKSIDEIKEFINSLKEKNILSENEALAVNPKKIKEFFDSEIGKRAVKSSEIHKEAPFVLKTKVNGELTLVQGTIDCYFLEDDKYVLLDYKSNYIDKENKPLSYAHLREMYLPQLRLYKEALEKITKKPVKEALLYLFGTSEVLEIKE